MYVCMHACMYVYMYVCVCMFVCVCLYVCMFSHREYEAQLAEMKDQFGQEQANKAKLQDEFDRLKEQRDQQLIEAEVRMYVCVFLCEMLSSSSPPSLPPSLPLSLPPSEQAAQYNLIINRTPHPTISTA